jgi:hypothetical protein
MVSALGEHHHPLGRLPGPAPGMVLNIGSGICAGFFPGGGALKEILNDRGIVACGAIGRWICIEKKKRIISPLYGIRDPKNLLTQIAEQVFQDSPVAESDGWVRGSHWWSTEKIVTQMETLGRKPHLLNEHGWARLLLLNQEAEKNAALRQFIRGVGRQLAEVVLLLSECLSMIRVPPSDPCRWTERIVLTGAVGTLFGNVAGYGDLLIEAMQQVLGKPFTIVRSEIGHAAEREAAGFLYYRNLI